MAQTEALVVYAWVGAPRACIQFAIELREAPVQDSAVQLALQQRADPVTQMGGPHDGGPDGAWRCLMPGMCARRLIAEHIPLVPALSLASIAESPRPLAVHKLLELVFVVCLPPVS